MADVVANQPECALVFYGPRLSHQTPKGQFPLTPCTSKVNLRQVWNRSWMCSIIPILPYFFFPFKASICTCYFLNPHDHLICPCLYS